MLAATRGGGHRGVRDVCGADPAQNKPRQKPEPHPCPVHSSPWRGETLSIGIPANPRPRHQAPALVLGFNEHFSRLSPVTRTGWLLPTQRYGAGGRRGPRPALDDAVLSQLVQLQVAEGFPGTDDGDVWGEERGCVSATSPPSLAAGSCAMQRAPLPTHGQGGMGPPYLFPALPCPGCRRRTCKERESASALTPTPASTSHPRLACTAVVSPPAPGTCRGSRGSAPLTPAPPFWEACS